MRNALLLSAMLALVLLGCSHSTEPNGNPGWLNNLIAKYRSEPVGNPPQSIWRYHYNGQTVYYVPPQCCDQFSILYDSQGDTICAPDGGFTGRGDGRCPDFFTERTDEQLVWKDSRAP